MGYTFQGIHPIGIGELALILDDHATTFRATGSSIDWLLRNSSRSADASLITGALSRLEAWAGDTAVDLRWRAEAIESAQQISTQATPALGALNPRSVARFAIDALFTPSTRTTSYRSWVVTNEPRTAAEELRRLNDRITNWSGSDNDPILDDLVRQAQEWRTALGVTSKTMIAVAAAMRSGQTPSETGLPEYLFPASYLDDVASYEAQLRTLEELEAEGQLILDSIADAQWGSEEFRALHEELARKSEALQDAEDNLARPSWETPEVHDYLLTNPLLDYQATRQVAGAFLATIIDQHPDSITELASVAELLDGATTIESQAFFNALGPIATAALPGAMGSAVEIEAPGGPAATALRQFSEALATASHRGLHFTGSDLFPPFPGGDLPSHLMEVNPAMLFLYGRFDADFVIDAALRPLEDPEPFRSILEAGPFGQSLVVSVSDIENGQLMDMRAILFERVAELGPDAAVALVDAAAERGVLDELVRPRADYVDWGGGAGGIIGQVGHDIDAARNIVAAIGAETSSLPPGVAVGAENMFLPHVTALIQGSEAPSPHLVSPISPLATMSPGTLDAFLRSVFVSGAGGEIADEVDETIVFEVYAAAQRDIAAAHSVINSMNDELGQMVGRVEAAEFLAGKDIAKHRDQVNSVRATISGMLLEAGISLVPVGRLAGITWNTAAQVGSGMAADVSVGALTDRFFPTDAAEHLYRAKIEDMVDDVEQGAELTVRLLSDLGLLDTTDMPTDRLPFEAWLDSTYIADTGHTVDDWGVPITAIYAKGLLTFGSIVDD